MKCGRKECLYYGNDCGFVYDKNGQVCGVESNDGEKIDCDDCEEAYR